MPDPGSPVARGLLAELAKEEAALMDAYRDLRDVQVKYDIAERRFAAIRDAVATYVEGNPYAKDVVWPLNEGSLAQPGFRGRFRFARMNVLDAVEWALGESDKPLAVIDIAVILADGGLPVTPRAVNASLLQAKRVERLTRGDGEVMYRLRESEVDPADLPF